MKTRHAPDSARHPDAGRMRTADQTAPGMTQYCRCPLGWLNSARMTGLGTPLAAAGSMEEITGPLAQGGCAWSCG
jgi:hypothetical protein